jgi:hypothetical protein
LIITNQGAVIRSMFAVEAGNLAQGGELALAWIGKHRNGPYNQSMNCRAATLQKLPAALGTWSGIINVPRGDE